MHLEHLLQAVEMFTNPEMSGQLLLPVRNSHVTGLAAASTAALSALQLACHWHAADIPECHTAGDVHPLARILAGKRTNNMITDMLLKTMHSQALLIVSIC